MKKIRVWKVILLSIVTFEIYSIVWFVRRRSELISNYKLKVPHWGWLLAPSAIGSILTVPVSLMVIGTIKDEDSQMLVITGFILFWLCIVFFVNCWWLWKFGRASQTITNGRITPFWLLILYASVGGLATGILQYYFNRCLPRTKLKKMPTERPSRRFMALALVLLVISSAFGVWVVTVDMPTDEIGSRAGEANALYEKQERLYKEYEDCIKQLDAVYPESEITPEDEAEYNQGYDACESIRIEQNKAVDDYEAIPLFDR